MKQRETITVLEKELDELVNAKKEGMVSTTFATQETNIKVNPTYLEICASDNQADVMCAVSLSRISEISLGRHESGWYVHIYLKGTDGDFFNIRIA